MSDRRVSYQQTKLVSNNTLYYNQPKKKQHKKSSNFKNIKLSSYTFSLIYIFSLSSPSFHNLTHQWRTQQITEKTKTHLYSHHQRAMEPTFLVLVTPATQLRSQDPTRTIHTRQLLCKLTPTLSNRWFKC